MSKTKVWVAGAKGGLGSTIVSMLDKMQYKVFTSDVDVDITNMESVSSFVDICRPDVVINCVGYFNPTIEKQDVMKAYNINSIGARNLAAATQKIRAKLIHISTDDVFSGKEQAELTEFDPTYPNTIYGKSKLAAENYVRELNPKHLIIRSSWVYGSKGNNFVNEIIKKARAGETIIVPNDQISSPTSAKELAKFIVKVINSREYGVYHAACEGNCTRFHFALAVLKASGLGETKVEPTFSETGARHTVLQNLMMEITGIYKMSNWKDALEEYIKENK